MIHRSHGSATGNPRPTPHLGPRARAAADTDLQRRCGKSSKAELRRGRPWGGALAAALLLCGGACTAAVRPDMLPSSSAAPLEAAVGAHPVAFLDRLGWGADAGELQHLRQVGALRFLQEQLHPLSDSGVPGSVARALARLPVNRPLSQWLPTQIAAQRALFRARHQARTGAPSAQSLQGRLKALQGRMSALTRQAMTEQLLLALYAQDQLRQRLIWFWMNHFNVFRGGTLGPMMADYRQRVIAPHALGHFRSLLQATMFSPQMLLYLNNAQNHRGHINENYAREVMELHTVGLGAGYSQRDVTDLAHVLTGLGVDLTARPVWVPPKLRAWVWQRGLVLFNPLRHDPEPEQVLGQTFSGRGVGELKRILTLLADDPATARHISFELAQYFVADHPSPTLVSAMVHTWLNTQGDITAVLQTMFTSPQFAASLARPQFKDPMRYVLSAVRASFEGRYITHPQPLLGMLYRLGEPLYGRQTPDGYPLNSGAWNSPGQLTTRFAVAQQLAAGAPLLFHRPRRPVSALAAMRRGRPARLGRPPDLAHSAVYAATEASLSRSTRRALAQSRGRVRWNALWLSSPEFMTD